MNKRTHIKAVLDTILDGAKKRSLPIKSNGYFAFNLDDGNFLIIDRPTLFSSEIDGIIHELSLKSTQNAIQCIEHYDGDDYINIYVDNVVFQYSSRTKKLSYRIFNENDVLEIPINYKYK